MCRESPKTLFPCRILQRPFSTPQGRGCLPQSGAMPPRSPRLYSPLPGPMPPPFGAVSLRSPRLCPSLPETVLPAARGHAPRCPRPCSPLPGAILPCCSGLCPPLPGLCPPAAGAVPLAARSCTPRCPELCPPQWRCIFGSWVSGRQKVPCPQTVGGQWDRTKPRKICHEGVRFTCYTENRWRSAKTGAATDG